VEERREMLAMFWVTRKMVKVLCSRSSFISIPAGKLLLLAGEAGRKV